jgi:hypothetical protein
MFDFWTEAIGFLRRKFAVEQAQAETVVWRGTYKFMLRPAASFCGRNTPCNLGSVPSPQQNASNSDWPSRSGFGVWTLDRPPRFGASGNNGGCVMELLKFEPGVANSVMSIHATV